MKISKRKYGWIDCLKKKSLGDMPIFESDKLFFDKYGHVFVNVWKQYCNSFAENINYVSAPFYHAASENKEKLLPVYADILQDQANYRLNGTFIAGFLVFMIDYKLIKGNDDFYLTLYIFTETGVPVLFYNNRYDSTKTDNTYFGWISAFLGKQLSVSPSYDNKIKEMIFLHVWWVVLFDMFKTYASVETKHLPAKSIVKDVNCKYINETDISITHLDSTWFTNLIKSDAFKVRGHFRLQPIKKDGKWTRELIWINEFKKNGYTRKAGILNQQQHKP